MRRIKLIVTGSMEQEALHKSLERFFPKTRNGEDVVWDRPQKIYCVTNLRLRGGRAPSQSMLAMANAMLAEAWDGSLGVPADLVVAIDDVELGNVGQEGVVAQHLRDAMNQCLDEFATDDSAALRARARERCSFHMLNPMVESYIFGDTNALAVAGVQVDHVPMLVYPDVEQFETNDPAWMRTCHEENRKKAQELPWWRHERHPKKYLDHLIQRSGRGYRETRQGKDALTALHWAGVPKAPTEAPMIRSLFADIAEWFGIASPLGTGAFHRGFYPAASVDPTSLLLRNL
jgi:hypothetical protein